MNAIVMPMIRPDIGAGSAVVSRVDNSELRPRLFHFSNCLSDTDNRFLL